MGFHIIVTAEGVLKHHYVTDLRNLSTIDGLTESTIIYEADEQWVPRQIKDREDCKIYLQPAIRAGLKAEDEFLKLTLEAKLAPERIQQSIADFETYKTSVGNDVFLKRPDFRMNKLNGVVIEVKCQEPWKRTESNCFSLKWSELKGLLNFGEAFHSSVYLACYERVGDSPILESLKTVSLAAIFAANQGRALEYIEPYGLLLIPQKMMYSGLTGLK